MMKPKNATSNWPRNLSWVDMRHLHYKKIAHTPTLLTKGNLSFQSPLFVNNNEIFLKLLNSFVMCKIVGASTNRNNW